MKKMPIFYFLADFLLASSFFYFRAEPKRLRAESSRAENPSARGNSSLLTTYNMHAHKHGWGISIQWNILLLFSFAPLYTHSQNFWYGWPVYKVKFHRLEMSEGWLKLLPALQNLILMVWVICDLNSIVISLLALKCQDFKL